MLSGGALESGERRRRWGQRFQAVRWPAQRVERVRDEYSPQRSLAEYRSWDVMHPFGWQVLCQLGDEVCHREELEALLEVGVGIWCGRGHWHPAP